jgi:predicted dehydrogenase
MVKEARDLIKSGKFGKIRKVIVEYPQGWLSTHSKPPGQKQADWRTDPNRSGKGGAVGDIGTHAGNLAEYVTGLKITELCADVSTFVEGRLLDDDINVLIHMEHGC